MLPGSLNHPEDQADSTAREWSGEESTPAISTEVTRSESGFRMTVTFGQHCSACNYAWVGTITNNFDRPDIPPGWDLNVIANNLYSERVFICPKCSNLSESSQRDLFFQGYKAALRKVLEASVSSWLTYVPVFLIMGVVLSAIHLGGILTQKGYVAILSFCLLLLGIGAIGMGFLSLAFAVVAKIRLPKMKQYVESTTEEDAKEIYQEALANLKPYEGSIMKEGVSEAVYKQLNRQL